MLPTEANCNAMLAKVFLYSVMLPSEVDVDELLVILERNTVCFKLLRYTF